MHRALAIPAAQRVRLVPSFCIDPGQLESQFFRTAGDRPDQSKVAVPRISLEFEVPLATIETKLVGQFAQPASPRLTALAYDPFGEGLGNEQASVAFQSGQVGHAFSQCHHLLDQRLAGATDVLIGVVYQYVIKEGIDLGT